MRVAAYVYPGWHPVDERPGFSEWDLIYASVPRFEGHVQPRLPSWGAYDDRDPLEVGRRVALATAHGIDVFVYGYFWCRGKRVFQDALDRGFLGAKAEVPFGLMWANRMPRQILPVKNPYADVIDPARRVSSDIEDFVALVRYLAERYFLRPNYVRVGGRAYFSIFDSTFFLLELGVEGAREAIASARRFLRDAGHGELHLAAIDPSVDMIEQIAAVGFDSVTNYVLLPEWKGPFQQDYRTLAEQRANQWSQIAARARLPYHPSVSPGWDASPRGADFGRERPVKYPWSPVVTGEHPALFGEALSRALRFSREREDELVFIASLNEWSEGHYLEPDTRYGMAWLEAVRKARDEVG